MVMKKRRKDRIAFFSNEEEKWKELYQDAKKSWSYMNENHWK